MIQFVGSSLCPSDQYSWNLAFHIAESESDGRVAARPRVLVVDDERLLADTTAAILGRAGFIARAAYDGFGALETMASFHPDYLLTDIMMPVMNGIELAIAITKMYPTTKILLFSGQAGISEILEDSKAKGFEFPVIGQTGSPIQTHRRTQESKQRLNGSKAFGRNRALSFYFFGAQYHPSDKRIANRTGLKLKI